MKFESIDLQHLLLGFILEDQGLAELQLRKALGIDQPELVNVPGIQLKNSFLSRDTATKLREIFSGVGSLSEAQALYGDMPLTEAATSALSASVEHARGSVVSPLHILWAMFNDEQNSVTRYLVENGVTREQVESAIRDPGAL